MNVNNYSFQRFTSTGAKLGSYTISVNKSYSFGFNSGFWSKEGVSKYKKVVLFFDNKIPAIGFLFTNDENAEGAFALMNGKSNASVSCRSFFIKNDLLQERFIGRYTPKKVSDDKLGTLYVIDLIKNSSE